MSFLRLPALAAVVVFALPAACKQGAAPPPGGPPRGAPPRFSVDVAPVVATSLTYEVRGTGSLEAAERVRVTARVSGVLAQVGFDVGDAVKAGGVLARIDPDRYRIAVAQAEASRDRARAQLDDARARAARREALARGEPLVSQEELQQVRAAVALAEADLALAEANLRRAELDLSDSVIRSPVTGTIDTRDVDTGQYANAGTPLATIVRRDPLRLRFHLPESEVGPVSPGLNVHFRLRGGEERFGATVVHIAEAANAGDRMVAITASVSAVKGEAAGRLRPGAFAAVTVPVAAAHEALVVPVSAVRASERGFLAYVVEGDTARERVLELGMRTTDAKVEVRAGLAAGELVVVRGADALGDGSQVVVPGRAPSGPAAPTPAASPEHRP